MENSRKLLYELSSFIKLLIINYLFVVLITTLISNIDKLRVYLLMLPFKISIKFVLTSIGFIKTLMKEKFIY
jgi:hypothetical protein